MILGIIHKFPYFSGINPAQAENPISFLLCFRDPNDVQKLWKNTGVSILEGGRPGSEASKRSPEGQKRWAHTATIPGRVGPHKLGLDALLPSIFPPPTLV